MLEAYGIVPGTSYGKMDPYQDLKALFEAFDCGTKLCQWYRTRYYAVNSNLLGLMPTELRPSWMAYKCDSVVQGCARLDGYVATPFVDHDGDDISQQPPGTNIVTVYRTCNADPACKAFTHGGLLKSKAFPVRQSTTMSCFYQKLPGYVTPPPSPMPPPIPPRRPPMPPMPPSPPPPGVCPALDGFKGPYTGVDHPGDNIYAAPSRDAASDCITRLDCLGMDNTGWLKTRPGGFQPAPEKCMYLRDGELLAASCLLACVSASG
ncbi:hypothetical protein PLESTB_000054600 [Pleodorina starrii]|uniref:Uncharacterized protein n=1 Tax=Pleodorina starrii TaxID=330485 RepID=A0A9W6EXI8_9CHLO|nr:hypothetical protein PLESTB_000054600 [Pleodorina starrii]